MFEGFLFSSVDGLFGVYSEFGRVGARVPLVWVFFFFGGGAGTV